MMDCGYYLWGSHRIDWFGMAVMWLILFALFAGPAKRGPS